MSLNPNVRNACIEVLLNKQEEIRLDKLRGGLGRSPYFRALLDGADRAHGMPPAPPRESRGCRGQGKQASRGAPAMSMRRRF
jgi:hypothetical protein